MTFNNSTENTNISNVIFLHVVYIYIQYIYNNSQFFGIYTLTDTKYHLLNLISAVRLAWLIRQTVHLFKIMLLVCHKEMFYCHSHHQHGPAYILAKQTIHQQQHTWILMMTLIIFEVLMSFQRAIYMRKLNKILLTDYWGFDRMFSLLDGSHKCLPRPSHT